jgi:hypothetical protein
LSPRAKTQLNAVDSFSYLSVLLSIILGLAITQVLQGLRGLILTRAKVKLYIPTLIWARLTLLIAIQAWWGVLACARMQIGPLWPSSSSCSKR